MNKSSSYKTPDFFKELFVPGGWYLSPLLIEKNNWCSIIVRELPDYIQCEWLSDAARTLGLQSIVYVSHGGDLMDGRDIEVSINNPHTIFNKIIELETRCLALTSEELDFVFFRAGDNSYYILAGSKKFMEVAFRASFKAVKYMFFCELKYENEVARRYFKKLWRTYIRKI